MRQGRPDPFVVVEAGAGNGRLAATCCAPSPTVRPALHYVLVERSARLRAEQATRLPIEPVADALGPATRSGCRRRRAGAGRPGSGPSSARSTSSRRSRSTAWCSPTSCSTTSRSRSSCGPTTGWDEVRVAVADDGTFVEVRVPATDDLRRWVDGGRRTAGDAAAGRDGCGRVDRGRGRSPAPRRAAARRLHRRLGRADRRATAGGCAPTRATPAVADPLTAPGTQDVTVDVPIDDGAARRGAGRARARPRHHARPSGSPGSGSTHSSPRGGPVGRPGRRRPTWTRWPGGAGSPRPPRSPIRPGSALTPCSGW